MKNFHKILLAFCLLFGGASTTSKATRNGLGALAAGALGAALLKIIIDSDNVRSTLRKVGITPGEAQVITGTLSPLAMLGFLGVEPAAYAAKWEVVAIALVKVILGYPGKYVLHNIPFVGDTIVPKSELNSVRGDGEQTSRFALALIAIASFPLTQQFLMTYCSGLLKKYNMHPTN